MDAHHLPSTPEHEICAPGRQTAGNRPRSWLPGSRTARITASAVTLVLVAASCGSDDDSDPGSDQVDEQTSSPDAAAETDPAPSADPSAVAACLADAGFQMEDDEDLLSEQQRADSLTLWGQTDSLTFDAATSGFAGGITFFETPAQAEERSEDFAEVAEERVVVGNVLILVEAGTGYEAAVAAAEGCL